MSFFSDIANLTDPPDSKGMTLLHYGGQEIGTKAKGLPYQFGSTRKKEKEKQTRGKVVQSCGGSIDQDLQEPQDAIRAIENAEGVVSHNRDTPDPREADTEPESPLAEEHSSRNSRNRRKGPGEENFKVAWQWIRDNQDLLIAMGWTKAELFRRGRFRCPLGRWGVAWLDVWSKEGLSVSIGARGQIVFKFSSNNRMIQQSAYPAMAIISI